MKQESRRSCCIRPTDNEKAAFDDTSATEASGVGLPISQPAAFAGNRSLTGQYCVGMRRFQKLSLVRKRWWRWWWRCVGGCEKVRKERLLVVAICGSRQLSTEFTQRAERELFTCSRPLKFESRALLEDSTALFLHQPDRD